MRIHYNLFIFLTVSRELSHLQFILILDDIAIAGILSRFFQILMSLLQLFIYLQKLAFEMSSS